MHRSYLSTVLWKVLEHPGTCVSKGLRMLLPNGQQRTFFLTLHLETLLKGRHVSLSFHFKNHKESLESWI